MSDQGTTDDIFKFAFNRKKVKYSILNAHFGDSLLEANVNLYIDMQYVLDILHIAYYKNSVEREFVKKSNLVLAELFNFIVHYKRYFVEKLHCNEVNIILLFDNGEYDSVKHIIDPTYDKDRVETTIKPKFIGFLANKLKEISNLVPNIYSVYSADVEFTHIPSIAGKLLPSKYNIFISNNPILQQYSQMFKGYHQIHPNADNTRFIRTNKYFEYLHQKNKYSVKAAEELVTHDSFIKLFLALTEWNVETKTTVKTKKAIGFINEIKRNFSVCPSFSELYELDPTGILAKLCSTEETLEKFVSSEVLYDMTTYNNLVNEEFAAVELDITAQIQSANNVSRKDFQYYNENYFNGLVDISTLFI